MSGLNGDTYYGRLSKLGRVFNKLDPNQVREAIEIAQMNFNKEMLDISKVDLQYGNKDIPDVKLEPIEYVVEEEKQKDDEMEL